MQMQVLLIVLMVGCSPCWMGCNPVSQEPQIIEVESSTPQGACDHEKTFELNSTPNSETEPPFLAQPVFYDDILNVFTRPEYRCTRCHGEQYQDPNEVKRKWTELYASLQSGFMPRGAPPVTAEDLALLSSWQAAGFPLQKKELIKPSPSQPRTECE